MHGCSMVAKSGVLACQNLLLLGAPYPLAAESHKIKKDNMK